MKFEKYDSGKGENVPTDYVKTSASLEDAHLYTNVFELQKIGLDDLDYGINSR